MNIRVYRTRPRGQFIPISAMVMFSLMIFMVAIVNVYKVSRVKLKVQNLADAAALNLASQAAQAYNVIADRNEWLNRMTADVPSPSDPNAPANVRDCSLFNMGKPNDLLIPPIVCVENNIPVNAPNKLVFSRRVWNSRGNPSTGTDGGIGYAMLVHTVNTAQKLFVQAYNSFLGARTAAAQSGGSIGGPANFEGLLKKDIPELDKPGIRLVAWNSGEPGLERLQDMTKSGENKFNSSLMRPLNFKVHHDIATRYQTNKSIEATTLGGLLFGKVRYGDNQKMNGPLYGQPWEDVGWMVPDTNQPTIPVGSNSKGGQVGVGVYVSQDVKLPVIGSISVGARSKAYIVRGSGDSGDRSVVVFKPTYWVKLAN